MLRAVQANSLSQSLSGASSQVRWSSRLAFHLGAAGAAVGLGSIWRFPYLAGTGGGSAFILVFVAACLLIAAPLLAAEYAIGRRARCNAPEAAGEVAVRAGRSRAWSAIGTIGAIASVLMFSYYSVIAGWVMAYSWKAASGALSAAGPDKVAILWKEFLARPLEVGAWHAGFVALVILISARGLNSGIEAANKIRGPALLALLGVLVMYALTVGDVARGVSFAFQPDFSAIDAQVVLTAVGQAFYATGVGQAMMIAYGAYVAPGTSLVRTSLVVIASILLISLLSTLMVFPLVFHYGMDPAQGSQLVFEVLPRAFAEMPGGQIVGTLFFLLLTLAAWVPSVALLEPAVAWLQQRCCCSRVNAALLIGGGSWLLGIGSVLSFNVAATWYPLGLLPHFASMTFFDVLDYVVSNIAMPVGALLTSLLMGWLLHDVMSEELAETPSFARRAYLWLLRYVCPIAIVAIFIAAVVT